ncbi:uridine kinase [Mesonia sp. K7]|uniref:uridine kinase n=1 Tax=Mesonia sp. K7 TaxID=2218606 RepID=UPI000DA9A990|nr:uridine kinase [Mesonia sp. K7]PZD78272.1 uridine kinase [Mesonia sp. K7]
MLIIGIAGGTGCGKTTVVNTLIDELQHEDVALISQDSYYKDTSNLNYDERAKINFDHPQSIDFKLLVEHLRELKKGNAVQQPIYSFVEHNRTGEFITTPPKKVMLVEGILIFNNAELRDLCDIKIFIHADSDERLIRRLKRDINERGRDLNEVLDRYQNTLKPMHQQFIEPTKEFADIIIPNNRYNNTAIKMVKSIIEQRLH